jgi:ABC-2 type transport system ATP-binding protein
MVKVVELQNLTKSYGEARGISDINLTIEAGEIFGFIGPNGAGKSTTIRTMLGLLKPNSGSVTIFGQDALAEGPAVRQRIGYLPSEVFYYDNMRAIDLLRYSGSFYALDKTAMEGRIQSLAKDLQLDLHKKIEDMSFGNKKKVGVIQGILHQPDLIILDEPTGGLDPLMQKEFYKLLRQENERGATILFSSHNLGEVQRLCHRVGIIKDGRLIRVETVDTLLDNSYKRIKLQSSAPLKKTFFSAEQITDATIEDKQASFLWRGDASELIKKLSQVELRNVLIEEPDLEEVFLHYYKDDDANTTPDKKTKART